MEAPDRGVPWLLEIYPASTLKRLGLHRANYKKRSPEAIAARGRVLGWLEQQESVCLSGSSRDAVLNDHHGDALDSIVAAYAAWRAIRGDAGMSSNDAFRLEGFVYH